MSDTNEIIAARLAYIECGVTDPQYVSAGNRTDAADIIRSLEAAGLRVVPADLVTNAEAVCEPADDYDWTIVRLSAFDALAASLAAHDGDSPLNVFAGNP